MQLPSIRDELRYGVPAADQILFNRYYVLGYSYYFRQAKWALEIVNDSFDDVSRLNNFRPDYRVPEMYRADLVDYEKSGYDRGHLVSSANQKEVEVQNSETFLLSNMSPQVPEFNRGIWKTLEQKVRKLNSRKDILETYVLSGPIFYFDKKVKCIGKDDKNEVNIPVPHAFFKSILSESKTGAIKMYSFIIANEEKSEKLNDFAVSTRKIERYTGIHLWENLVGSKMDKEKTKTRKL